jgi:hypothetical protein
MERVPMRHVASPLSTSRSATGEATRIERLMRYLLIAFAGPGPWSVEAQWGGTRRAALS